MSTSVILIGPLAAGQTTVGRLLAEQLDLALYSLDQHRTFHLNPE